MKLILLTGLRFGRLTVLCRSRNTKSDSVSWVCRCDCGNRHVARGNDLRKGLIRSCGCLRRELTGRKNHKHGHNYKNSREYRIWLAMRARCSASNHTKTRAIYYDRGIRVSERWNSFTQFLLDMGPAPSRKHSIDRIDNNGPYVRENCRWATPAEQSRNSRRTLLITHNGKTQCATDWAHELGISEAIIRRRFRRGVPIIGRPLVVPDP